jgi:hypothetical protein
MSIEIFLNLFDSAEDYRNDKFRIETGIGFRKSEKTDFLLRGVFQRSPTSEGYESVIRITVKQHFGF